MNGLIPEALAQTAGAPAPGGQIAPLLMMVLFVVIFYFLLIRPQQKKTRDHQTMVSKLVSGDEVITAGGLLGRIIEVGESFITVEIADGVRVKVQKQQITSLVPKGTLRSA